MPQQTAMRWERIAERLRGVAASLEAGRRETPQRFIPLAMISASERRERALLRFLVEDALAEAAADAGCSPLVRDLLREAANLLAADHPDWCEPFKVALEHRISAAAPNRRRRRHIHCHGVIASDRRLLLLREALRFCTPDGGFQGWAAIAYAMSDYDRDHFVMVGSRCAGRVGRLASWVERSLATPTPFRLF